MSLNWQKINSAYSKKAFITFRKQKGKKRPKRETFKFENHKISDLRNFVLNLQINLAEAIRNNDIDNCRKIINKIVKSKETRALAVYDTISKRGYRTPGYKDNIPMTNDQYRELMDELWAIIKKPAGYKASPLHRKMIEKPQGGLRPISVPTYRDRAIQHLYKYVLEVFCEESSDPNSFGFRKFRSPGWASKAVTLAFWQNSKSETPPKYVFSGDITKCFDTIEHDFIINNIGKFKIKEEEIETIPPKILREWLKCGYIHMEQEKYGFGLQPTEEGVPQGGPISPVISNMTLNGLESFIKKRVKEEIETTSSFPNLPSKENRDLRFTWSYEGQEKLCTFGTDSGAEIARMLLKVDPRGTMSPLNDKIKAKNINRLINSGDYGGKRYGWSLSPSSLGQKIPSLKIEKSRLSLAFTARFADDFLTVTNTYSAALIAKKAASEFLAIRGLELNETKSQIIDLEKEPFRFVGFEFKVDYKKKVIYNYPPAEKVKKVKNSINELAKKHKTRPFFFFKEANAVLRGWCNFYRVGNSKIHFQNLNRWLWFRADKYFSEFYKKFPSIAKGSQDFNKRSLKFLVRHRHLTNQEVTPKKWWSVPNIITKGKSKSNSYKKLFLVAPTAVRVATPSIKTTGGNLLGGLNAFHPLDRDLLLEKTQKWQFGLIGRVLDKTKGLCAKCSCELIGNDIIWEIHHIKPIKYGGPRNIKNLIPLCKECHKEVTSAMQRKDLLLVQELENLGILSGVMEEISSK